MQEIIIDQEFKLLLPALDAITYAWLEENILEHGCMQPLVLWNSILIDGHNRYEIVQKHGLPFNTIDMEFDSRDDVIVWIISTQVSRRNLTPMQLSFFRGLHYNTDKRAYGNSDRLMQQDKRGHNVPFQESTATRLGKQYNVSGRTIKRDAQLAEAISAIGKTSPEAKRDILEGKTPISRKTLRELFAEAEDNLIEVANKIETGTFELSKPEARTPEVSKPEAQTPEDSTPDLATPIEKKFSSITEEFHSELSSFSRVGDNEGLRVAFRLYMNRLEEMFKLI